MSKVITANELASGAVVFLGANDIWVGTLSEAVTFEDDAAAERGLERAQRGGKSAVVEPFVSTIGPDKEGRSGMTLRDQIRAYGPTVRFKPGVPAT